MKKVGFFLFLMLFIGGVDRVLANPTCSYDDPLGNCGYSTCTAKPQSGNCGDCCDETHGICFKYWTCWTEIGWEEDCHGNVCRCFSRCGSGGGGKDAGISCSVSLVSDVEEVMGSSLSFRTYYKDKDQCSDDFSGCNTGIDTVGAYKTPKCRRSPAVFGERVFTIRKNANDFVFSAYGYQGLYCCGGKNQEGTINWVFCPDKCRDELFGGYDRYKCEAIGGADPTYGPQTWADLIFSFSGRKPFKVSFSYEGVNFGQDKLVILADGIELASINDGAGDKEIILANASKVTIRRLGFGFGKRGYFKVKNLKFTFANKQVESCINPKGAAVLLVQTQKNKAVSYAVKNGFGTWSNWQDFVPVFNWQVDESGKITVKVKNSSGTSGQCFVNFNPCLVTPTPNLLTPTTYPGNKPPTCQIVLVEPKSGTEKAPATVKFGARVSDDDGEITKAEWSLPGDTSWDGDMFYLVAKLSASGDYMSVLTVTDDKGDEGVCKVVYRVNSLVELSDYWFQAKGGDIHAGGFIGSNIPDEVETEFLLEPAGVVSYGLKQNPILNSHKLSLTNLKAGNYSIFNTGINIYSFSYFETNINKREVFGGNDYSKEIVIDNGRLTGPENRAIGENGAWLLAGNTIYKGGFLGKTVFLVNGTLKINENIEKDQPIFIVSGDIKIDEKVTNLSGVFLTDGMFKTNKGKQLKVKGSVIADGFSLLREETNINPSELFSYDPSYLIELTEIVGKKIMKWQEIAP